MRAKKLTIRGVGIIKHEEIVLDKSLLIFYGEIRQGKSTILSAVRWVCGAAWPDDIIRHGEKEASIELELDNGIIARSWYRGKTGETKARDIQFIRNGKPVPSPAAEIKRLLNPFLTDQDYLARMTETERRKYFTELFAVDTTVLDVEAVKCESAARELRAKIKGYGEIDLTKVEAIDASALKTELGSIRHKHNAEIIRAHTHAAKVTSEYADAVAAIDKANDEARAHNYKIQQTIESSDRVKDEIRELHQKIKALEERDAAHQKWLKTNPSKFQAARPAVLLMPEMPPAPDTSELETKISEASANAVQVEQYNRNLVRAKARKADEDQLKSIEARERAIKEEKTAKLSSVGETCGIPDLSFDEVGNFVYQGTSSGMLSTSQIQRLSMALSSLYPDGLGLELLDRGESLGKSIFELIDRAKAEDKTILAAVVGERPAKTPSDAGVFVVDNGEIFDANDEL